MVMVSTFEDNITDVAKRRPKVLFLKVAPLLLQIDRSAAELATVVAVLHQLNMRAAGIGDPGLPGSICAEFLLADFYSMALQGGDYGSQIFHFQTEMPDGGRSSLTSSCSAKTSMKVVSPALR